MTAPSPIVAPALRLETRPDGVALIVFDTPDSPVNVLSREFFDGFSTLLDAVAADPAIVACVLTSAKPDSFIAGADLQQILAMREASEGAALSRDGHALLDRMAISRKPFVAAIHGPALGGGLEVALACHYRLVSDDPRTVLALPEVSVGLLPAGGGTQRLPSLVGLAKALPMLLTGKRVRAKEALRMGLVDAVTGRYGLVDTAARAALLLAAGRLHPRRGPKGGALESLMALGPVQSFILKQARDGVMAKTRGLYPAPLAILACVEAGLARGPQAGAAEEATRFGALVAGAEAKHLIRLFDAMTELKKAPAELPAPRPVAKLGVIGAGLMGEGITAVSLGLNPVVLKDVNAASLGRAADHLAKAIARRVRSGGLSRLEQAQQWNRLWLTERMEDLAGSALVIEAVFEKLALKREVLAAVEAVVDPNCVFASNTSALPIRAIAAEARHPERVLGMHYFSPVPKMPLLELVITPATAAWAIATARAYGVAQGKTVITVQDGPGFYTTRILAPFLNEAVVLLEAGAAVKAIDRALKDFGFPVGPLALVDEVGLDVGAHVARDLGAAFAERGLGASDLTPRLLEAGLAGRKNGQGFYLYGGPGAKGGGKAVNPKVYALLGDMPRKEMAADEIRERLVLLMVNEAAHCLEEGIITSARDGDVGAILGLGFPPFRGGPFRYVDDLGAQAVVERLDALEARLGKRFAPAPALRRLAAEQGRFYPEV